ncbi:class I SAM-dependent methyltransferase [Coralloluteibacterium stylophorae]|nr:class I SAM-dependent methyltransferase [Coralloluteibacterium stylophorae]
MIEHPPRRVLDVGCGAGGTAVLLRQRFPDAVVVGVEPDAALAELARAQGVTVIEAPVERASVHLENDRFDLIICADVLEHLQDPWKALHELRELLAPAGQLVTSIPNVRHVSTFWSLGVLGTWPRRTRGIHDATHLRFFARRDILDLGASCGFRMRRERRNMRLLEAAAWSLPAAKLLDFWPFRPFLTFQYLHRWDLATPHR